MMHILQLVFGIYLYCNSENSYSLVECIDQLLYIFKENMLIIILIP